MASRSAKNPILENVEDAPTSNAIFALPLTIGGEEFSVGKVDWNQWMALNRVGYRVASNMSEAEASVLDAYLADDKDADEVKKAHAKEVAVSRVGQLLDADTMAELVGIILDRESQWVKKNVTPKDWMDIVRGFMQCNGEIIEIFGPLGLLRGLTS